MLGSLVLALVVGLLAAIEDELAVLLLLPLLCFVIGFARVLYGAFIAERRTPALQGDASQPHNHRTLPGRLGAAARSPELSPPRVAATESFIVQRMKTAEMVQPPSVTENTTRLLDEEADARRE